MFCLLERHFRRIHRLILLIKFKYVVLMFVTLLILNYFGVSDHLFEIDFDENFSYPYEGDVSGFVKDLKQKRKPKVEPINHYNFSYIHEIEDHCVDEDYQELRVVFLIKSSVENVNRRLAIRQSWGRKNRFIDVPTRTIFLLGKHVDDEFQNEIDEEAKKFKDIMQSDFVDSYYNNTIKTMMGFKWAVAHCSNSKFYMFVDDDFYVSVKNVLAFVRNPVGYPDYLKESNRIKRGISSSNDSNFHSNRKLNQVFDIELPDTVRLFTGYVFISSPHRHRTSKWFVSLNEYPYHLWPPYVTAGSYIVSKEVLIDMYYTSFYTKHFKFDDIYLGLIAKKAQIEPFHCDEFHFYKKHYTKDSYKYVITSHGYENSVELLEVWNEQKSLGNA